MTGRLLSRSRLLELQRLLTLWQESGEGWHHVALTLGEIERAIERRPPSTLADNLAQRVAYSGKLDTFGAKRTEQAIEDARRAGYLRAAGDDTRGV